MKILKKVIGEICAGRRTSAGIILSIFIVFVVLPQDNARSAERPVSFEYEDEINVEQIRVEKGLSHNSVTAIYQDAKGFLWFGTENGLNRYDGYELRQYRGENYKFLLDEWTTAITGDPEGNLWIGTHRMGLRKFDSKTKTFKSYKHNPGEPNSLCSNNITALSGPHRNSEGMTYLWIGTDAGLTRMTFTGDKSDEKEIKFETFRAPDSNGQSGPISNRIRKLYHTKFMGKQCLWIGTEAGLSRFIQDDTEQQWCHFIRTDNEKIDKNGAIHRILTDDKIMDICETGPQKKDGARTLWVATYTGLNRLNWKRKGNPQVKYYRTDSQTDNIPNHNVITALIPHRIRGKEILWLGTVRHGLKKMDINTGRVVNYREDTWTEKILGDNRVTCLFLDRSGILWMGGRFGGVSKIVYGPGKIKFRHFYHTPNQPDSIWYKSVRAITESADGSTLWIGTYNGGLNRLERTTGRVEHFQHDPDNPDSISSNRVFSLFRDRAGLLWVGTEKGLDRMREDRTFEHFDWISERNQIGYVSTGVRAIREDRAGNLWLGTTGGGLYKYDQKRKRVVNYRHKPSDSNSLSGNSVYSLSITTENEREIIWIGTYGTGLNKFDTRFETFTRYLREPENPHSVSSDKILCICRCPHKSGRFLYIGTHGGSLCKFDTKTELFVNYIKKDGLLDHVIYGCLDDNSGNLWLSTSSGIIKVDTKAETFRHYDASDGLQGNEFNGGAYFKSRDGEYFFGGTHGLNSFYPEAIKENTNKPAIIVSVNVDFKEIAEFDSTAEQEKLIKLSHSTEIISFQFAALDFTYPAKNQYRYMLKGIDKNWVYSGTQRTVNYLQLKPGEYEFHVRGSNNDGVWNEKGASVRFEITPPLTDLFWFRAAIVLGLFTFMLILARMWVTARKKQELQNLVEKRTGELKKATDDAQELAEKAEHANQAKSRFLANMSHEIRTPMAGVVGLIELMQESQLSAEQIRHIKMIKQSAGQLMGVLNDILDFSKIEAGQLVLESLDVNLHALINEISEIFQYRAGEKGILFSVGVHGTVPERVMGDPKRLKQILLNLLGNAVKFTEKGMISLTVYLEEEIEKKETVPIHFVVSDTGIGIPENRILHLFESFTQADVSTTRRFGGTGLGLAISKQLVELMTGKIWARSKEGEGTDFHFIIPFIISEKVPEPKSVSAAEDNPVEGERRKERLEAEKTPEENSFIDDKIDVTVYLEQLKDRVRLLLVEDNPINQKVAMSMVKRIGMPMDVAADGLQALEALKNISYDLILMDVQMPNMDGLEATKKIREELGLTQLPIIALTANALKEDMERCYTAGMNDFIMKPFKPNDLYRAFMKWLPRSKIENTG